VTLLHGKLGEETANLFVRLSNEKVLTRWQTPTRVCVVVMALHAGFYRDRRTRVLHGGWIDAAVAIRAPRMADHGHHPLEELKGRGRLLAGKSGGEQANPDDCDQQDRPSSPSPTWQQRKHPAPSRLKERRA
jgi:hypothetical protein